MSRPARTSRPLALAVAGVIGGAALVAVAGGVGAGDAAAAVLGNRLVAGKVLGVGDSLRSPLGVYSLSLQTDGNLVLYGGGRALWSTGTNGRGAARLVVQGDGNLVLSTAAGAPVWASFHFATGPSSLVLSDDGGLLTVGANGAAYWGVQVRADQLASGASLRTGQGLYARSAQYRLVLQGDGNLVLYSATNVALWSTRTSGAMSGVTVQPDGDVVLRRADGSLAWHTGTSAAGAVLNVLDGAAATVTTTSSAGSTTRWRTPAAAATVWRNQGLASGAFITQGTSTLRMQTDGNFVHYVGATAVWSSKTASPGATLAMQRDGNLVVYSAAGAALWSSRTPGTTATYLRISGAGIVHLGDASRVPNWIEGPPNWAGLADCESGGNPRAVNPAGYYGLYQFDLGTWKSNGGTGNPVDASPAVQTAIASTLYLARGRQPWPTCGKYL